MSRLYLNNLSFEKLGQFSIFDQANSIANHTKKGTGLAGAVEGDARRSSVCRKCPRNWPHYWRRVRGRYEDALALRGELISAQDRRQLRVRTRLFHYSLR